jgi:hypothetical protein
MVTPRAGLFAYSDHATKQQKPKRAAGVDTDDIYDIYAFEGRHFAGVVASLLWSERF